MNLDRRQALAMTVAMGATLMTPQGAQAQTADGGPQVSNAFDAFRRLYSSADDKPVCWWYDLETFATAKGWPTLHLLSMQALFACRSRLVSPDEMHIDYVDIGIFMDPATGKPVAADWVNPITRLPAVKPPVRLPHGSGGYRIVRKGDGVEMTTRGDAVVVAVEARYTESGPTSLLEYVRTGQTPTGPSVYRQSIIGSRESLKDRKAVAVGGQGEVLSRNPVLPPWAGFGDLTGETVVQGSFRKSALGEVLNPGTVALIQPFYPEWFVGGVYTPRWPG